MKKTILIVAGVALLGVVCWRAVLWLASAREVPCGGSPRLRCMSNLSQFGKAMAMYVIDHSNAWPTALGELAPRYLEHPKVFRCPETRGVVGAITNVDDWTTYCLVSLTQGVPSDRAHAFCPPENHGGDGANVLFHDCSVNWMSAEDFEKLIRDQKLTEIRKNHQQHLRHVRE